MHLKNLEIVGFKSFSKSSTLSFPSRISAIVGPNGSGKSNIAEAFRFVLGEQSIKSMRGKRSEDMIFSGSDSAPRMNRASVKVVFDNSSRDLKIDFDEVAIQRIVFRDSTNQYLINGSQVRLKDVIALLSDQNIGASGHHIISQGESDRILSVNPRERKTMVEEALGLRTYQYKKDESLRKLAKTNENLLSVESLRREIAPHIRFLKKQVEKIERTHAMRAELIKLYKEYLKRESAYLAYQKKTFYEDKEKPLARKRELEKSLAEAEQFLSELDNVPSPHIEALRNTSKELEELREHRDKLSRTLGRLEGMLQSERSRSAISRPQSEESYLLELKEVEDLARDIRELIKQSLDKSDPDDIRGNLFLIQSLLDDFIREKKNSDASGEIKANNNENQSAELEKEIEDIKIKLEKIKNEDKSLSLKHEELKKRLDEEKDSGREAERKVFAIKSELQITSSELHTLDIREDKLIMEEEEFNRELNESTILADRSILMYKDEQLYDQNGRTLAEDEIASEPRHEQLERRRAIEKIKIRLEDLGSGSGEDILKEYEEVKERDQFLEREIEDLKQSAESLSRLIKDLEEKIYIKFNEGIVNINEKFQEFFDLVFGGGKASLVIIKEKRRKRHSEIEDI
jgi:chromosome segregation protein